MQGAGKKGELAAIAHKLTFPPRKPQETVKRENCHKKCVSHLSVSHESVTHQAKPKTPVMLAFLSKILHNFDKTKRRKYWSGPSGLDCSLQAESDQRYALNSTERCCKAAAFCLNFSFIKDCVCYFPLCQKKNVYPPLQWFSFS